VALERLDGTFAASAEISIGKARTAALFFETVINQGRTAGAALPSLPDFAPLQGGVPIMAEDQVIGAVGISGAASPKQDEEIAILAAAAVKSNVAVAPPSAAAMTTTYLHHNTVGAAFAKGQPLLEVPGYKVHASRRDAPGVAEVHLWETDVIYVLDGEATFVTGGTVGRARDDRAGPGPRPEDRGRHRAPPGQGRRGRLDGIKVDHAGNLFVSGPGGVWIISPGRKTSWHDWGARAAGQLRLGRRRGPHPVHDRAHRPVPDPH
jgi:hypothetical protein